MKNLEKHGKYKRKLNQCCKYKHAFKGVQFYSFIKKQHTNRSKWELSSNRKNPTSPLRIPGLDSSVFQTRIRVFALFILSPFRPSNITLLRAPSLLLLNISKPEILSGLYCTVHSTILDRPCVDIASTHVHTKVLALHLCFTEIILRWSRDIPYLP